MKPVDEPVTEEEIGATTEPLTEEPIVNPVTSQPDEVNVQIGLLQNELKNLRNLFRNCDCIESDFQYIIQTLTLIATGLSVISLSCSLYVALRKGNEKKLKKRKAKEIGTDFELEVFQQSPRNPQYLPSAPKETTRVTAVRHERKKSEEVPKNRLVLRKQK